MMTPYFCLLKIADIVVYIISKFINTFQFWKLSNRVFSHELKFSKIMKKILTTISVMKYTIRHIL